MGFMGLAGPSGFVVVNTCSPFSNTRVVSFTRSTRSVYQAPEFTGMARMTMPASPSAGESSVPEINR